MEQINQDVYPISVNPKELTSNLHNVSILLIK